MYMYTVPSRRVWFMDLPPELADNILSCVSGTPDAKPTLSTCALVCHTWRELAYPYLFRTMHLNFSLAKPSIIEPSGIAIKTVEEIIEFFTSSRLVSSCIRTLRLRQVLELQAVPATALYRILEPFHGLRHLTLSNVLLVPTSHPPLVPSLQRSVDFLEIYMGDLRAWGDYRITSKEIYNTTSLFSGIDHLCLSVLPTGFREESEKSDIATGSVSLPAGRELTIINPSSLVHLFRALQCMPTTNLRAVNFGNMASLDFELVSRFLATVGSTLESLKVGELSRSTTGHSTGELLSAIHTLNLHSTCPVLDTFTFSVPFGLADNLRESAHAPVTSSHWHLGELSFEVIKELLTSVVPPWVRSVGLVLRKNVVYNRHAVRLGYLNGEMDWKVLDEVLVARAGSRKDASVRVEVDHGGLNMLDPSVKLRAVMERAALEEHLPRLMCEEMLRL
ncbi:hypothetical protein BC835DRAFT_1314967 [Cytidiella melzeri]|nr:hypothetical protein BC835DRAFT_1314967 [Cytidiella melzeri]